MDLKLIREQELHQAARHPMTSGQLNYWWLGTEEQGALDKQVKTSSHLVAVNLTQDCVSP